LRKKIKDLKGFALKTAELKQNIIGPTNPFLEFKKEEIHQSIGERFEEQVKKYPGKVAVKTGPVSITYDALNKQANRTAHAVLETYDHRYAPGAAEVVALLFGRGADKIAALLGVLKTGMAYVPLDTSYPTERLVYMLEDSGARLIVTDKTGMVSASEIRDKVNGNIGIININDLPGTVSEEDPGVEIHPTALAYILYTSGSTGKPKGVMQNHVNVLHFARVYTNALHIHPGDKLTLFSSFSFDAAKMDIYGALLNGACLYPYDIKGEGNLRRLPQWLRLEGISIYHSIPTVYRYFTDLLPPGETDRFPSVRFIVLGGEAVFKKDIDNYKKYFSDKCLFINGLGPTESTVTLQYFIDKNTKITREAVPVGFPVDETNVYLLTEQNREAGVFGVGEIVFKSDYLAPGYWKLPEQTQKVFTSDPLTNAGRVYRTGDLGRRLPNGGIEYAGRKDFQVKVSGYRIELGEIESKLDRVPGIKKSVVVCCRDGAGERFLAAYYTGDTDESVLTASLKSALPDYMVPSVFLALPEFPLTSTGKIDRKKLSQQDISHLLRPVEREAPSNETEIKLLKLWKEILKQEIIGVNENFFVLGGNSIKAVLLVSALHKETDVEISLKEIFKNPTIKESAAYINKTRKSTYKQITPAEKRLDYPLSSAQERFFFLNRFEEKSTRFNIPVALGINGPLDIERYTSVIGALMRRHEVLRTSFHSEGDRSFQRVHTAVDFKIEYCGAVRDFIRPYDLSNPPLFRVGVFSRSEYEHQLLFDIHHIIFDGASMGVLTDDFIRLYNGEVLKPLDIQYKDFAVWQREQFERGIIKKSGEYWLNLYSDAVDGPVPRLNPPVDFPRPGVMSYEGDSYRFYLDNETSGALKTMAAENNVSLFMLLLALYNIFLSRLSGREDIISAVVVSGRNHRDVEDLLGVFVNMLALRNYPCPGKFFPRFLEEVGESTMQAFENRDYPFEELIEKLPGSRDVSRHPLADVGFTLQNAGTGMDRPYKDTESELRLIPLKSERKSARNDLNLEGFEIGDRLELEFQYRTKLFKEETIIRFSRYFKTLISEILENPGQKIGDIELLSKEEREQLLVTFNNTKKAYPGGRTVFQLFEEQVERNPGAAAVRSTLELQNIYDQLKAEDIEVELSYEELNERSNQSARWLRERGVRRDGIVGLLLRHPLEKVVGIWGVLKSGGAYLPIDPLYPATQINGILADSGVRLLVSETGLEETLSEIRIPAATSVIFIDEPEKDYDSGNLEPVNDLTDLAYVIYTSGTTGRARGAAVEHRGIVNYACWRMDYFGFTSEEVTLQPLTYSFDSFCANFYATFLSGGELVLVPDNRRMDYDYIVGLVGEYSVTNVCFAPGIYNAMLAAAEGDILDSLKFVVLAGEAAGAELIRKSRKTLPHTRLANEYGPTEGTVAATCHPEIVESTTSIIGTPIANAAVYILDELLNPVLPGVVGEIVIGGTGVARGYLNNPELTNSKFQRPFNVSRDTRPPYYRTGDLGRWLSDGTIEFLGRKDFQVKVRGFRIELGQIESVLAEHEGIEDILVDVKGEADNKYICAYIIPRDPDTFYTAGIKDYLGERLPDYMVPSHFVPVEKFPLTRNGKIDRGALPDPGFTAGENYTAPRNRGDAALVEIWSEVLTMGKDRIGIDSDFFDLGGHSLKAAMVVSKIRKRFDFKLSLTDFFDSPTIRGLSELIKPAAGTGETGFMFKTIGPVEKRDYYPASSQQKRLYALQQFDRESTAYNVPGVLTLTGNVDVERIRFIAGKLIERHEAFRTGFQMVNGEPVQRIYDTIDTGAGLSMDTALTDFIRPFDLSAAPLLRLGLVRLDENGYLLTVDMHHIIADGLSTGILVRDVADAYEGKELGPLTIQYKDYALWRQEGAGAPGAAEQEAYWLRRFGGEIPVSNLPTDYRRPLEQSFEGARCVSRWDEAFSQGVNRFCGTHNVTLFMLLFACYNVLLSKYGGREDVIVGTPVAGRDHADLEGIIGMFTNTLAIRSEPAREKCFLDYLAEIRQIALESFDNQDYPFEEMLEKLNIERDLSRNPLFDTMFVMQNIETDRFRMGDIEIGYHNREFTTSKFDLTLTVSETGGKIGCVLEYCTKLFKEETIDRLGVHFRRVVEGVLENPVIKISGIDMLTAEEKETLLYNFNDTEAGYPKDLTVHELFERRAAISPDSTALVFGEEKMTYRELNRRADRLASLLWEKGVRPDIPVGIMVERSFEMIVGILGILKAGGVYMPIDPGYPKERKRYMLADSGAALLLTARDIKGCREQACLFPDLADSNNLAYIIYTSGSTGRPRGVLVSHRNVVRLLFNDHCLFDFSFRDVWTLFHSFCFDFSVWEMYGALLYGGRLVIIPEMVVRDFSGYLKILKTQAVTVLNQTPSAFYNLMDLELIEPEKGLNTRYVIFGGEALSPSRLKKWKAAYPQTRLINMYGITETTVHVTFKELGESDIASGISNVGKPIPTLSVYITDRHLNLQPIGVAGELCVSGAGLARGYLNNPDLTAEKFHRSYKSYRTHKTYTIYKSGDLARWLPNGEIEFLGRIDSQVKIRGYRIETGEIESRLLEHVEVKEAVVIPLEDNGDNYLCAYIVPRDTGCPGLELREFLSLRLPHYMIPSYFMILDAIPLTLNGKIDRKALPDHRGPIENAAVYKAPETALEIMLAEMWRDVLGAARVGLNDNFFALGGHSLKAIQLVSLLEQEGIKISVGDIFRYGNVKSLVENKIEPMRNTKKSMDAGAAGEPDLVDRVSREEIEKLSNDLERDINAFNETILGENVVNRCPLSAIQISHLQLSNRSSGDVLAFDGYPDQERFYRSIINVIGEQGLLRSRLVKESGTLSWYEHEMPADLNLPVIDLSGYSADLREEIGKKIISRFFPNRGLDVTVLPYSIVLIKKTAEDYILVLAADHTVYDAMSGQVIRSDIDNYYYRKKENVEKPGERNYEAYVRQINRGPRRVDEDEIIEVFQLKDFRDSIIEVNRVFKENRSDRYVTHEIELNFKDIFDSTQQENDKSLEISLNAYAGLCRTLFNIEKVPLLFFSLGRKYEDKHFFGTVGEFIDLVPIVVDTTGDTRDIIRKIEEKIAFAAEHNINFMTTVMNRDIPGKWDRVIEMLTPGGIPYDKHLLRFNFAGERDEIEPRKENGNRENETPGGMPGNGIELEGATFWSHYNKHRLKVAVGINMDIDRSELQETLDFILTV